MDWGARYGIQTHNILRRFSTNITHFTTCFPTSKVMFLEYWYHGCMKYLSVISCWLRGNETCRHVTTEVEILIARVGETPELEFHRASGHLEAYNDQCYAIEGT